MIISPVPQEKSNQPQQPIEIIYRNSSYRNLRVGGQQYVNAAPPQLPKTQPKASKIGVSDSKSLSWESGRVIVTPSKGKGNSLGSNGDDDSDITIGIENWKNLVCPDPEQTISNSKFWNTLEKDPETCLD